jgi:hypothetical protein
MALAFAWIIDRTDADMNHQGLPGLTAGSGGGADQLEPGLPGPVVADLQHSVMPRASVRGQA